MFSIHLLLVDLHIVNASPCLCLLALHIYMFEVLRTNLLYIFYTHIYITRDLIYSCEIQTSKSERKQIWYHKGEHILICSLSQLYPHKPESQCVCVFITKGVCATRVRGAYIIFSLREWSVRLQLPYLNLPQEKAE